MIARYDITQRSEEWQAVRYGKIGGSTSKGLFVKSDTLLISLLAQLTEEFEPTFDDYESPEMMRGNDLEPIARKELSKYTGLNFIECGWLQSEECDLLGISPDGITGTEMVACELKCPSAKAHISMILDNEIPLEYMHQCLHYFTVNPKLDLLYFCSYRPESIRPLFVKTLTPFSAINLGTNAKPNMVMISDAVKLSLSLALELEQKVKDKLNELSF